MGMGMGGAGNPLDYDYHNPAHVERYATLVVRDSDGSRHGASIIFKLEGTPSQTALRLRARSR